MSIRTYNFGYFLGTAVRECLRSVRTPAKSATVAKSSRILITQLPVISATRIDELCQVPAMVRIKGVNLNDWFNTNVVECNAKKAKSRKRRAPKPCMSVSSHFLGGVDTSTFTESDWDRLSR